MSEQGDLEATHAYTRGEVEAYLQAVADQSAAYRAAIAEAHARTERAQRLEQRIVELERRVGQWIVAAHVEAAPGHGEGSGHVHRGPFEEAPSPRGASQAPDVVEPQGPEPSRKDGAPAPSPDGVPPRVGAEERPWAWSPGPAPDDLLAQIRGSVPDGERTGAPVGGHGGDRGG
jgi:hypothetical protein